MIPTHFTQSSLDLFDDRVVIPIIARGMIGSSVGSQSETVPAPGTYFDAPDIDLDGYDRIVVCMSGGKDSIASLLRLFDMGVDRSKIELWHHDVDGREGSTLMDWPFMADYNRKLAAALDLPLYFSWLDGGLEGEMLKENSHSRPHRIETPDGLMTLERDTQRSAPSTRLRFPQQSASLHTRWCSSALKIDVGRRAINNQPRFDGQRILFVTGERREESSNRARYNQMEPHACDRRKGRKGRLVDAWRPVLHFNEAAVWEMLAKYMVIAPVPYRLSWGRSSCLTCVFNAPKIWATIAHHFPEKAAAIAAYENRFGTTISRSRLNVLDIAKTTTPHTIDDMQALGQAMSQEYTLPIIQEGPSSAWRMPAGAFSKEGCGSN